MQDGFAKKIESAVFRSEATLTAGVNIGVAPTYERACVRRATWKQILCLRLFTVLGLSWFLFSLPI